MILILQILKYGIVFLYKGYWFLFILYPYEFPWFIRSLSLLFIVSCHQQTGITRHSPFSLYLLIFLCKALVKSSISILNIKGKISILAWFWMLVEILATFPPFNMNVEYGFVMYFFIGLRNIPSIPNKLNFYHERLFLELPVVHLLE